MEEFMHRMFFADRGRQFYTRRSYKRVYVLTTEGTMRFFLDGVARVLTLDPEAYERSLHIEPLEDGVQYRYPEDLFEEEVTYD